MPKPRKALVSPSTTPYYHCVSRCVRRAFLCGLDPHTGKSYEHRRQWVVERMLLLAEVFAIDICSYAVMSNHYHVILHLDTESSTNWSEQEVIQRWSKLFSLPALMQHYLSNQLISKLEKKAVAKMVAEWRSRLQDISWFMRCLNEPIARRANQEDNCTGRYWEGRFKSQALLDEKALVACMAYVDLNPIRASLAKSLADCEYTSIVLRIGQHKQHQQVNKEELPSGLLPFSGNPRQKMPMGLPFELTDYLDLVEWTANAISATKREHIPEYQPPVLERLQIATTHWLYIAQHFESKFKGLVGSAYKLKAACQKLGYLRTPNLGASLQYFA